MHVIFVWSQWGCFIRDGCLTRAVTIIGFSRVFVCPKYVAVQCNRTSAHKTQWREGMCSGQHGSHFFQTSRLSHFYTSQPHILSMHPSLQMIYVSEIIRCNYAHFGIVYIINCYLHYIQHCVNYAMMCNLWNSGNEDQIPVALEGLSVRQSSRHQVHANVV